MNIIPKPVSSTQYTDELVISSISIIEGDYKGVRELLSDYLRSYNDKTDNKIIFIKDNSLGNEEYIIDIKDNIVINASSEKGAFYACQTIIQLAKGGNIIPKCNIKDKPKYSYRGFMLDVARHYFSVDKIKQILDLMANLKMNFFHWHLSEDQGWRAEIKKYPLLTQKGAIRSSTPLSLRRYSLGIEPKDKNEYGRGLFYTQEEMKNIVAYAKSRHIEVIPEIDMPGHIISAIACYPNLSCSGKRVEVSNRWGIKNNIACCGKEDIYTFVKDVIDELIEIFPCKYFHIGGDEVPKRNWKACPNCQAKIRKLGLKNEEELQGYFNNVIAEYLKSKNRIMIGWNEILDSASILDKNIIAQWWIKRKGDRNEFEWMKKGGKFILSTIDYLYMDHPYAVRPLSKTYNFNASALEIRDDSCVLGVEAPQWTEYIRNNNKLDLNTLARLVAIAEVGWTRDDIKDYQDFESRLENLREYFLNRGYNIAPKEIYQGKTVKSFYGKFIGGWKMWRRNPNFELELTKNKE